MAAIYDAAKRVGDGYSEVAMGFVNAVYNDRLPNLPIINIGK